MAKKAMMKIKDLFEMRPDLFWKIMSQEIGEKASTSFPRGAAKKMTGREVKYVLVQIDLEFDGPPISMSPEFVTVDPGNNKILSGVSLKYKNCNKIC